MNVDKLFLVAVILGVGAVSFVAGIVIGMNFVTCSSPIPYQRQEPLNDIITCTDASSSVPASDDIRWSWEYTLPPEVEMFEPDCGNATVC